MDSAIVFATKAWFLVATIGVQGLLAWMLGPEGRGAYAVCFVFGMLFGLMFTIGVDRAAQHFVMNKQLPVSQGVTAGIIIASIGSAIAMVVGWLLIHTSISFFQKAAVSDFELSLLLIPSWILNTFFLLQLNGLRRFISRAVITVVQTTTNLLLVILFLGVLGFGVKGALWAQVISLTLAIALQVRDLRVHCGFRLVLPRWSHYRSIVHYGARYFVANLGHMVDVQLGVILLGFMATPHEIGLFSAAAAMSLKIQIFAQSVEVSMLPRIASDADRRIAIVCRYSRLSGLFTGLALILLVLISFPLVRIVLSPSFLPAVPLIWILAPGILFQAWGTILTGYFRVINRPGLTSWSICVGLMTNGLVFYALYPEIGVSAAAWSMSLGFGVHTLILIASYQRTSGAGLSQTFWPQREDIALIRTSVAQIYVRLTTMRRTRHDRM
jgi:O-antigen/teichoic acid export membrane protein